MYLQYCLLCAKETQDTKKGRHPLLALNSLRLAELQEVLGGKRGFVAEQVHHHLSERGVDHHRHLLSGRTGLQIAEGNSTTRYHVPSGASSFFQFHYLCCRQHDKPRGEGEMGERGSERGVGRRQSCRKGKGETRDRPHQVKMKTVKQSLSQLGWTIYAASEHGARVHIHGRQPRVKGHVGCATANVCLRVSRLSW